MKVIDILDHGKNNSLILTQKEIPKPNKNELLIEVKACGVNRPDILQRYGLHPPPKGSPSHPGLEVSGIVIEVGSNVNRHKVGDHVMALLGGGGYAEYAIAHQNLTLKMPKNISFIEAASIPETYFTVWNNVFRIGKLKKNENILIHGGSSGIGTTAIQIAKKFDANVITTTSNEIKVEKCYQIGADLVVNYNKDDFSSIIMSSEYNNIDLVLDIVGGNYTGKNYELCGQNARIIQIAYLKGSKVEIDLSHIMRKSITHTGSTLRPKSIAYKTAIAKDLEEEVLPLISKSELKPIIYEVFPLNKAEYAHRLMKSGSHFGKIVLVN